VPFQTVENCSLLTLSSHHLRLLRGGLKGITYNQPLMIMILLLSLFLWWTKLSDSSKVKCVVSFHHLTLPSLESLLSFIIRHACTHPYCHFTTSHLNKCVHYWI